MCVCVCVCVCVCRNVLKMHVLNIINYRGIKEKNIGFGSLRGLLGGILLF